MKIGFIGLGLIGGSLAKTIKRVYPGAHIIAADPDRESVRLAIEEGIVKKEVTPEYITSTEGLADLTYLFLCAPVITNISILETISRNIGDSKVIISDVGSVKSEITGKAVEYSLPGFIGGHPMAGSEKTGFANANDHLFENVYYILTNDAASKDNVLTFTDFILSLDAIPIVLEASYHDFIMSGISHTPHFIAAGLVNTVKDSSYASVTSGNSGYACITCLSVAICVATYGRSSTGRYCSGDNRFYCRFILGRRNDGSKRCAGATSENTFGAGEINLDARICRSCDNNRHADCHNP